MNFIARKLIMPGFWCSMVGAALALVVTDVLQALSQIYRHGQRGLRRGGGAHRGASCC